MGEAAVHCAECGDEILDVERAHTFIAYTKPRATTLRFHPHCCPRCDQGQLAARVVR